MEKSGNIIRLCGNPVGRPQFSHMGREGACYVFPLSVERLSGVEDVLNVVALRGDLKELEVGGGRRLYVEGGIRSFNNRSGLGPKLVITVQAQKMHFTDGEFENSVYLTGAICKAPILRKTPMGREICDIMLAVNRYGGRSDYVPCIAWGLLAGEAGGWRVGTEVEIFGRLQSRKYIKNENDVQIEKTAFEVSVVNMTRKEA